MILAVYNDVYHGVACRSWWKQNSINDVNHTIVRDDVSCCYLSIVDEHTLIVDRHCDFGAVQRRHHHAVRQIGAKRRAANYVVGQNRRKQVVVCKDCIKRAFWQIRKCRVRGGEHSEGTIAT